VLQYCTAFASVIQLRGMIYTVFTDRKPVSRLDSAQPLGIHALSHPYLRSSIWA